MTTVAVVDYGMGNLHSVAKALQVACAGVKVVVTDKPQELASADRIIFPGVGALRDCVNALAERDLDQAVIDVAQSKPFLGICLGMQALLEFSEENGGTVGLGVLPGRVLRFATGLTDAKGDALKIPHMGWNQVRQSAPHAIWEGITDQSRFYFVHGYYVSPAHRETVIGEADYGGEFPAVIAKENVVATQFHPEKSQQNGLRLLANFLKWNP